MAHQIVIYYDRLITIACLVN